MEMKCYFLVLQTDDTIYELSPIFDENPQALSSTWQSNDFTNVLSLSVLDFSRMYGCWKILSYIDSTACNYNENSTNDDGSCTCTGIWNYDCLGECVYTRSK